MPLGIFYSFKVRLVGGKTRFEGRVEVNHLGRWLSICGLQFTELDGEVVCRELGLGFIGKTFSSWEYGKIKSRLNFFILE